MKKIFCWLLCVLFFSSSALSQWSSDPGKNLQITGLGVEQAIPKIAMAPNGNVYIAFFSLAGEGYHVRLQHLDHNGNPLWEYNGILVSDHPSMSWLTDWDMAVDYENHAILTWQDIRTGNNNVFAYRIAPDGSFAWGEDGIQLSSGSAFDVTPVVSVTSANHAVFAWMSDDDIIMQKISPDGTKQWGDWGITISSADTYSWPQLLPVDNDEVVMKYYHDSGAFWAPTRNILAQRFDADGMPVWEDAVLVYGQGNITAWTQILSFVPDGNDGFYIGWHDYSISGNVASAWIQHVNASGELQFQTNGVLLSDAHANQQFYPMIASPEQDPNTYIFWQETDGNQNLYGIFCQKVSPDGDLIWGSQGSAIFNLSALPVRPLYALPADNDILLLYEYATGGGSSAIKAIRFNDQGEFAWPEQEVYVSSVHSSKMHTDIAFYDHTQWAFAWGDDRDGPREIYAQNLHPDGTLGIVETQTYLLNLFADPEEGGSVEGGGEYEAGAEVTAIAAAHDAYVFMKWTDEGQEVSPDDVYVFDMPAEDLSLVAHFQSVSPTGEPLSHHVRMFPNPSDSNLFISSDGRILSVDITDMTGRTVYSTKAGGEYEIRINTSTLRPGTYVVRIALDQEVCFEKLTIER